MISLHILYIKIKIKHWKSLSKYELVNIKILPIIPTLVDF